jgi:SDR family mycofactocin-dependent oxidoreductase
VITGLLDKVVVVTGAARGTGRVHCTRFADEGADVIALDAPDAADELRDLATEIERRGRRCATGLADVSDLDAVTATIDAGVAELGCLDVVVANAGIHLPGAPSWELDPRDWQRTIDINLTGVWHTVKASVPHISGISGKGGSVIIISSTSGIRGLPNTAHYTASKHAVVGLARTLANELGPRGIRVNTVHPGPVATPMVLNEATFRRLRPDLDNPTAADAAEVLQARNLLPVPWVEPVDIANAVVFLASDQARYITGTQLVVDAGLTQKTT